MKTLKRKRSILYILTLTIILIGVQKLTAKNNNLLTIFHVSLQPYGHWITIHGGYTVWKPVFLPKGWRPYTEGTWIWTTWGWYWYSDEPFAWIVYHYGRWYFDPIYGWVWYPDTEWGPAWVEWRYSDEYIGWAPLAPHHLVVIHSSPARVIQPYSIWVFVPYHRFSHRFHAHDFEQSNTEYIFERSRNFNDQHDGDEQKRKRLFHQPFTPEFINERSVDRGNTKARSWRDFGSQRPENTSRDYFFPEQSENNRFIFDRGNTLTQNQQRRTDQQTTQQFNRPQQRREQVPFVAPSHQAPRERRQELMERYERFRTTPPPSRRSQEERESREERKQSERSLRRR